MRRRQRGRVISARVTAQRVSAVRATPASRPGRQVADGSRRSARAQGGRADKADKDRAVDSIRRVPIGARAKPVRRRRAGATHPASGPGLAMDQAVDQPVDQAMLRVMRRGRTRRDPRVAGQRVSGHGHAAIGAVVSAAMVKQCSRPVRVQRQAQKAPTGIRSRVVPMVKHAPADHAATAHHGGVVVVPAIDPVAPPMPVVMPSETRSQRRLATRMRAAQPGRAVVTATVAVAALPVAIADVDKDRDAPWTSRAALRAGASASQAIGRTICPSNRANGWTRCPRHCALHPGKAGRRAATRCAGWL